VSRERVVAFVDGLNLYHAISRIERPHLKWIDLRALIRRFVRPASETLVGVYYFSAYADWLLAASQRHRAYVAALSASGVTPVMGKFKSKNRWCSWCRRASVGHEEKETDVNIALHLVDGGYRNLFDHALLVSRDSDLAPAVRMLMERFPEKRLTVVAPPFAGHSTEMLRWASGKTKIRTEHLEQSLFPAEVRDTYGTLVATRPAEYEPPTRMR
jgi:uncharacterized LabA/DUF88 family protein